MTHCDVESSSRNVAAGEVCGDGGGVEKAKIRLMMSSERYCKAHGEAQVCCLTAHQRLHECVHEWTAHNIQQLFDSPCHQGEH